MKGFACLFDFAGRSAIPTLINLSSGACAGALSARNRYVPSPSAVIKPAAGPGPIWWPDTAWKVCLTRTSAPVNIDSYLTTGAAQSSPTSDPATTLDTGDSCLSSPAASTVSSFLTQHHHPVHTMSSHVARLKEELHAKQHELQEQQAAIEEIEKLTRELEAHQKALVAKSEEYGSRQDEVRSMQNRLDALTAVESAVNAAMKTKSSTQDVVKHVVEAAIRSDHMTGSEIVQATLSTAMQVNGSTRGDFLDDVLMDLLVDDDSMRAAVEAAMDNSADVHDVVELAVRWGKPGANPEDLRKSIINKVNAVLDETAAAAEYDNKYQGWYHNHCSKTLRGVKLTT